MVTAIPNSPASTESLQVLPKSYSTFYGELYGLPYHELEVSRIALLVTSLTYFILYVRMEKEEETLLLSISVISFSVIFNSFLHQILDCERLLLLILECPVGAEEMRTRVTLRKTTTSTPDG